MVQLSTQDETGSITDAKPWAILCKKCILKKLDWRRSCIEFIRHRDSCAVVDGYLECVDKGVVSKPGVDSNNRDGVGGSSLTWIPYGWKGAGAMVADVGAIGG